MGSPLVRSQPAAQRKTIRPIELSLRPDQLGGDRLGFDLAQALVGTASRYYAKALAPKNGLNDGAGFSVRLNHHHRPHPRAPTGSFQRYPRVLAAPSSHPSPSKISLRTLR